MFGGKLMLSVLVALVFACAALYFVNGDAQKTISAQRSRIEQVQTLNEMLNSRLIIANNAQKAFVEQQNALYEKLEEQTTAHAAIQAKLNEVLHDESVKEWGDDVVPIAVGRLFEQQKNRDSSPAASAVSDNADVSANYADDQKK